MRAEETTELARLRQHLRQRRESMLATFVHRLGGAGNPLIQLPAEEIRTAAALLLDDAFRPSGEAAAECSVTAARIGRQRAETNSPPEASMHAASVLFAVVSDEIAEIADGGPHFAAAQSEVLKTLHDALLARVMGAALPYASGLLRQIATAHHQERRRIARDLHDQIAHSIGVGLQQLDLRRGALESHDPDAAEHRLDILRETLVAASEHVHEITLHLGRFQTADGFARALFDFVEVSGTDRVALNFTNPDGLEAAPTWILEEFFFAVREGITNALTHSGSDRVDVEVGVREQFLHATIQDYGSGLELQPDHVRSAGKGLVSMRERIELLGGRIDLRSQLGEGTVVDLRAPVHT